MLLWPEKLDVPSVGHGCHGASVHDVICIWTISIIIEFA